MEAFDIRTGSSWISTSGKRRTRKFARLVADEVAERCPNGTPAIYAFRAERDEACPLIARAFALRRVPPDIAAEHACYPRLNLNHPPRPGALHVGTHKTLRVRMRRHLGHSPGKRTSALRLPQWATGVDETVRLTVRRFDPSFGEVERHAIEQALWDEHEPLLGKRSGK